MRANAKKRWKKERVARKAEEAQLRKIFVRVPRGAAAK